jgi:predicted small lipoprotein YifL
VSRFDRPVARAAAVAALLALGLALSACGRKGPLDPPPGALVGPGGMLVETDQEGRPLAPPGQKKRIPLDVLLD